MKNLLKRGKIPTPRAPRPVEELNKLYSPLVLKLGETQLNIKRLQTQTEQLIAEINALEVEAKESQALEATAKKEVAKTEETSEASK